MQENTTVHQLNKALNELLNAYDKLKYENKQINDKNKQLEEIITELEENNSGLENQISLLSDTTKHNSNEIDTMLGRIKSILDTSNENEDDSIEVEVEEVINKEIYEEPAKKEEEAKPAEQLPQNQNKEIDLGRMQSLLNGFN
ncbi:MAG: hypothetical protein U9N59_01460 [Campylobacterota bacterium]|nr:hypothetical protein [Campylobacterota bacterium]